MVDNKYRMTFDCREDFNLLLFCKICKNSIRLEKVLDELITDSLEHITEREKQVLDMRLIEGLSVVKVGKKLNLPENRIRQIESKALRKLSTYISEKLDTKAKYPQIKTVSIECNKETPIEMLDLPTRTHNSLVRAGIKTVGDIINAFADLRIYKTHNLGEKGLNILREQLISMGVDKIFLE